MIGIDKCQYNEPHIKVIATCFIERMSLENTNTNAILIFHTKMYEK